ncbi:MAG: galactose oxidase-like domain-containing protein [Pseudonocardiaceae bacterium]
MLVGGGSAQYDEVVVNGQTQDAGHGFTGLKDAMIFDPGTETWKLIQPMQHGRWYPTLLKLNDGQSIATSGLDEQGVATDAIEKIAHPDTDAWTTARTFNLPLYPHLFLLRDGRLVYTGGKMDTPGASDPLIFDPLRPSQAVRIEGLDNADKCNQCASVILPPAQLQRFMILGGGPEDVDGQPRQPATTRVSVVDLLAPGAAPTYQRKADLHHERMHVNAVLLPDRTVLAAGGGLIREASVAGAANPAQFDEVFEAEIYDPVANIWALTAPATVARLYHSVALLLPDGRVVAADGNPDKGRNIAWLPPEDPMEEMRLEIYSPPYLFKFDAANPRPVIVNAPVEIGYGPPFTIETAQSQQIASACLIRPGLTTHSFNVEQRLVDITIQQAPPDGLRARVDVDARIAPPGWYMLFLTDRRGVPSVAQWVHLS